VREHPRPALDWLRSHALSSVRCLEAYFRFDPPRGVGDFDLADISRGADIEVAAQNYVQQPHVAQEIQRCAQILAKRP
jgi:hypothetical protein